jgi:hypothetical protein
LIVLVMTIFIVRSEHRDTQAIHAKRDELLRVQGRGTDEITMLDRREPEEIETASRGKSEGLSGTPMHWHGVLNVPEPQTLEFARTAVLANLAAIPAVGGWPEAGGRELGVRFGSMGR